MPAQPIEIPLLELEPILPEIILVGVAILVLLIDAIRPSRDQTLSLTLSLTGIAVAAFFSQAALSSMGNTPV